MPDLAVLNMVVTLAFSVLLAMWANARIARLIAKDDITEPLRAHYRRTLGTRHLISRWIECPWCCGWWTALPVTALAWFPVAGLHLWWLFPLTFLTVAHAAGRLNQDYYSAKG